MTGKGLLIYRMFYYCVRQGMLVKCMVSREVISTDKACGFCHTNCTDNVGGFCKRSCTDKMCAFVMETALKRCVVLARESCTV